MLLHPLLLLVVLLSELLRLLLVLAVQLLLALLIGLSLRIALVFLLLLLLELLAFALLPGIELVLLLVVFAVTLGAARVGIAQARIGRQVPRMNSRTRGSRIVVRPRPRGTVAASFRGGGAFISTERTRPGGGSDGRASVVGAGTRLRIVASLLHVLHLGTYGRGVPFVNCSFFLGTGARFNATAAAVIADARIAVIVDDGGVVGVVNDVHIHVVDGAVVIEMIVLPAAAFIAVAEVSVAVVNSAVEADVRPPVAFMKNETASAPAPPRRSPEVARARSEHPGSGNPVIVVAVPGPIARRPDVVVARADGLVVYRQFRRPERNHHANTELGNRSCGKEQHSNSKQQGTYGKDLAHQLSL